MKFSGLPSWRALSPGRNAAAYWGGLLVLLMLAGLPFFVLSATAPSSNVEGPAGAAGLSGSPSPLARPSPGTGTPAPSVSPPPAASSQPMAAPGRPRPAPSGPAIDPSLTKAVSEFRDSDFQVQCWPAMTVSPGQSSTVDCSIVLAEGFRNPISLACRVEGMGCEMSPDTIDPTGEGRILTSRLSVTASHSVPVGTRVATVTAAGGRAGSPLKQAEIDVNVPPPFSVACETVGTSFRQGESAQVKCWVTFLDGSRDTVTLSLKNGGGLPADLDVRALLPIPTQTRSFTVELDTGELESRTYELLVGASSSRYSEDATVIFSVVPAG